MSESDNCSDLLTKLQQLAERVNDVKEACTDEAKTRSYLVEPLLEALGYDCRDPRDVVYEFTADVAGKKGEKVDYALMRDGEPVVLVEAKTLGNRLGGNEREQLQRYFPFTPARLSVLTDGVQWHWYKGMSGREQSHQMESSPFLTYNAYEPSESAAEWLAQVTKDGFNPGELLRIFRRNQFSNRIRVWINETLAFPSPGRAQRLNNWVNLGASSHELPLVEDAARLAWGQFLSDQQMEVASDVGKSDPWENGSREPPTGSDPIVSGMDSSRTPDWTTPDFSGNLRLDAETYADDFLDVGFGRVLDARKRKRAWRVGGGKWNVEQNATEVTRFVLRTLFECDARRDHPDLLTDLPEIVSWNPSMGKGYRRVPEFQTLCFDSFVPNHAKIKLLKDVASEIEFRPPHGHPLSEQSKIEVWMPTGPTYTKGRSV